jgi:subtilisin family serine protease
MAKRNVIVELAYNKDLAEVAFSDAPAADKSLDTGTVPKIAGVKFDAAFAPTTLPGLAPRDATAPDYISGVKFDLMPEPNKSTYIVRAEADDAKISDIQANANVVGVFSDVEIQPTLICPGDPPLGTDADVERLLCVPQMHRIGMDGKGILVAIVDTGFNLAYLAAHGKNLTMDAARSWVPNAGMIPGNAPVSHGTMCAFDAAIAAPRATFLDIQLLRSTATGPTPMFGVLSDAVRAYEHLIRIMLASRRPGETRTLVVNNSWGMFHPSWDFPVGSPGNYSDNPNHPFNRAVAALERAGADILFAAGNCGSNCPDGRCLGVTANAIYGANGHASVLTVAGVDVTKTRVGYSTQGPGRLSVNKPDVSGYTHFKGSGVYTADGGTSAATPVVAGVVAAVRTKRPFNPGNPAVSPHAIRNLIRGTAEDLGTAGFDFNHGFGVVGGCALYNKHRPVVAIDICRRIPDLCRPRPIPIDICRRFPEICRGIPAPPFPVPPRPGLEFGDEFAGFADGDLEELLAMTYQAGYYDGKAIPAAAKSPKPSSEDGCGCGGKK